MDVQFVRFVKDHSSQLLNAPLDGRLRDMHALYSQEKDTIAFEEFVKQLHEIAEVAPGSVLFGTPPSLLTAAGGNEGSVVYISRFVLQLLLNKLTLEPKQGEEHTAIHNDAAAPKDLLDRLWTVLDTTNSDGPNTLLNRLQSALQRKLVSHTLAKERAQQTTLVSEFIPICQDSKHSSALSTAATVIDNTIVSMQWSKLWKYEQTTSSGFLECVQTHIHYIPNLRPQTDVTLGDCSYLDTCHKLSTCRYIHYLQYLPESLYKRTVEDTKMMNESIVANCKIPFYTNGYCCSHAFKSPLPPQWIKCDVRKFDFSILGKFSAVIADPAWNIHMNLPYGTCNDIELLELPLDQLQDEGILFLWVTGRAIELGKESLINWGYQVINEISWIKTNQLGRTIVTGRTGHWLNHSKEHLLVGLKGNPTWLNRHIDTDLIVSTTRETSRKPDELYGMVERMVGPHARKLEIFGRDHNVRKGWFTIGNQLNGTQIHELDVKSKYDEFLLSQNSHGTRRQPHKTNSNRRLANKIQASTNYAVSTAI